MFDSKLYSRAPWWSLVAFVAICVVGPRVVDGGPGRSKPETKTAPLPRSLTADRAKRTAAEKLAGLPLTFEPNLGQTDPQVRFLTRASGMTAYLTDRENVIVLSRPKDTLHSTESHKTPEIEQTVVRMKLEGSMTPRAWEGAEKAESITNYFIGNDPGKWRSNVPNYRKVRATDVYRGIDLVYYGDAWKVEYDFVVRPGGDPSQIRLAYYGADSLTTDTAGNLLVSTPLGVLVQRKPRVFQEIGGERREVDASYSVQAGKVHFALGRWDRKHDLVIDPVLVYSTYLSGSGNDYSYSVALDSAGLAYIGGYTTSLDFPVLGAIQPAHKGNNDVFVTKLDEAGALVYSTYLGGAGPDNCYGIAVDSSGQAYITGGTFSTDFPTTAGAFQTANQGGPDAFVAKLNITGSALIYSTYLGGNDNDLGYGIAVDPSGAAFVTGYTLSGNFPKLNAYQSTRNGPHNDAFIAKLKADGSGLLYSTYLGGSLDDQGNGIALDSAGQAYVIGTTLSSDFPTASAFQTASGGGQDAFVAKLSATGNVLMYSSYLGGSGTESGNAIAVDASQQAYVTGVTDSTSFPTTGGSFQTANHGGQDAFVAKVNATGSALVYSTYLGGAVNDIGIGIAVAADGTAYLTGGTYSTDFPVTPCAYQATKPSTGFESTFITKFDAAGAVLAYSTFLHGSNGGFGLGIAIDSTGAVYIGGITQSADFPTTAGAAQRTSLGVPDGFVSKLILTPQGQPASIAVALGNSQSTAINTAFSQALTALVTDAGGNPVGGATVTFTAPTGGATATLSAATAVTDCSGNASVSPTANGIAGTYTVTASVVGAGTPASFTLTNNPGAPSTINFVQQPTDAQAGAAIVPAASVLLKDAANNPIVGAAVTLSVVGGTATLHGTTTQITGSTGIATFPDINITVAGNYQLQALNAGSGNSLTTVSNAFHISPATSGLSITSQSGGGQSVAAGAPFQNPLTALVKDAFGNPVAGASVTFAAPGGGATVTFGGAATVTTNATGVATSPAMTASGTTGGFTVTASTPGASQPASFPLTIVAGAANKLAFVQQPSNAAAGAVISPAVTVQLEDSFGNPVASAGAPIGLVLSPPATLLGTVAQSTSASGLATFADLSVHQAGTYVLTASSNVVASATSASFIIHAGAAASITVAGGSPQGAVVLTPFAQPLQARVNDAFGNPVSGAPVTFNAPGTGASATLNPASANTDANGHASVSATANAEVGGYLVKATTPGAAGSADFALTNSFALANQITYIQQPSDAQAGAIIAPPVVVSVTDGSGHPEVGVSVAVSLQGSSVTLGGTLTAITDSSGQATFPDLSITTTGTYQLLAVNGAFSAVSNSFAITASTNAVLISVFDGDGQSAVTGTSYGAPLKALVQDPYGNLLTGAAVIFTAPSSGASVTFNGPTTVNTDSTGIAVSPAMTANAQTGDFQVMATTSGASTPALFNETNLAATNNRLAFVQQPSDAHAGAIITPVVTVQLVDSSGNAVHTPGLAVTLISNTLARRLKSLSGTLTENTDANGLATFADLSISRVGTYQLLASASGVSSATSVAFNITAGAPTSITATGGASQSALINTMYGAPLQATVTDVAGNPVAGVAVTFNAPLSGASGTFNGQLTIVATTDAQGHALASITANNIAGSFAAAASSTAITGSAVFDLTNLPAGSSSLVFVQQPANTAAAQTIAPPVTVQVRDASGNPEQVAGIPIVIALYSGTGALTGTVVQLTNSSGVATFNDLRIGATGTKTLQATSSQQAPATSHPFQITAGAAANVVVYGGSPQSTTVGQPFASLLQAQVTDAAGNPVGGVSVTFTAPASGPSGTFAGVATAVTDANGLATAPRLTANNTVGSFTVTAAVTGVSSQAAFALTNLPAQSSQIVVDQGKLGFTNQAGQPAPPGQTVNITAPAALCWTIASSAPWLAAVPSSGCGSAAFTASVNPAGLVPGTYTGYLTITDANGGVTVIPVTYTVAGHPVLAIAPPTLVFTVSSNTVKPGAQTLTATASSGQITYNVSVKVITPSGGSWLSATPLQGQTQGTVQVSVNPASLADGIYDGTVLFTPTDTSVNSVAVPVTLIVGCGQGGCTVKPIIEVIENSASFHESGAPRAILTIFGSNLSDAVYQAQTYPLPTQLGPTSVTVDGALVPLYYVSPTQINFQMPSGSPVTIVSVVVQNQAAGGSRAAPFSNPYDRDLTAHDPGLYLTSDYHAAALNGDLSVNTAANPVPAGGYIILFITGGGPITPPLPDGTAAPGSPLSLLDGTVTVFIGGKSAQVTYQGVAPGFAGLGQINAIVPSGLTPGNQPAFITVNGISSNTGFISVK
jgi:uncharacterized protein (TIGR03437 family)